MRPAKRQHPSAGNGATEGGQRGGQCRVVMAIDLAHTPAKGGEVVGQRLDAQGLALSGEAAAHGKRWTYANIALCRTDLLAAVIPGSRAALGPLLHAAMRDRRISAEVWRGAWENLGTPAQLDALNAAA